MAAEFQEFLAILDTDPANNAAISSLQQLAVDDLQTSEASEALDRARKAQRERGELELVAKLFDVEIKATADNKQKAELLYEKGTFYADQMLNAESALECFNQVLEIKPDDERVQEALAELRMFREHWERFAAKYVEEAEASTDRELTTNLYLSTAQLFARYKGHCEEVEAYLSKSLEADPRNRDAAVQLERLLRREQRDKELLDLLHQRVDAAATKDERIYALLSISELALNKLDDRELASETMTKVIAADPAQPRALRLLSDIYEQQENWSALVMLYTNALKAQKRRAGRDSDVGMLLQIAMLYWKRMENIDGAEEYFRRVRKAQPDHPAALSFYREFYPARNETAKLLQVLRQAQKSLRDGDVERKRALSVEIAELAEDKLGNPEKAIDSWKQLLRKNPDAQDARDALRRLYRRTEKWNALLDMMKDDIGRLAKDDVQGQVAGLMDVVVIYRDRLKLDVMVINTYNSILKLDPQNKQALDDLIEKYKQLGRWNDLISVLTKKSESEQASLAERVEILREIARLWSERFGNYAQAIKPLERLLEIVPDDEDTTTRLKEIYTRRRQWRALITLLQNEAARKSLETRRGALSEMASLATERLGDYKLAIEIWNRVLELPAPVVEEGADASTLITDAVALTALQWLYEREKRYLALAEIMRRQRAIVGDDAAAAVPILEKLGALLSDRLKAPALAAEAFQEILDLNPQHNRALRTLRELYAAAGDYDSMEALYGKLGQWDELVDAFFAIADRLGDKDKVLKLLERSALIASKHFDKQDKVARAYERVLSADPQHLGAAQALVSIYQETQKWTRLIGVFEILLGHASDDDEKLKLHLQIRDLCSEHINSKAQAFQWTAKAYELRPSDNTLLEDLQRIGAEADAWEEMVEIFKRRLSADGVGDDEKLFLLRQLGSITLHRLHQPEDARAYQQQVIDLAPGDAEAMNALEEIATNLSDWSELLGVFRTRAELEKDDGEKVELLFKVAVLEEGQVGDLDAAAKTYQRILDLDDGSRRALKSLAKIQEARGDWKGLAEVLEKELEQTLDADPRVDLLLRLGSLYENNLERRDDALRGYKEALDLGTGRSQVHHALERFLGDDTKQEDRADVAQRMLPFYETAEDAANIARAIEVLRISADDHGKLEYDKRLVGLYGERLDDGPRAYAAALRVLGEEPGSASNRTVLLDLAASLERNDDVATHFEDALSRLAKEEADPQTQKDLAAQLARLYEEQLEQTDKAEVAWQKVLGLDETDQQAFDALDRVYRSGGRWTDLRDLLLRREAALDAAGTDPEGRREILLAICDLEEGVLENPDGALTAYKRVLDLDPSMIRAYKALERLYGDKKQWVELEELIGRELDFTEADKDQIQLTFRRAELRAKELEQPVDAVDLLEEVVGRAPGHSDARELLEELLPNPDLRLRIAQILEPLYQDDQLWRDLCRVLRAQREFAGSSHEAVELLSRVAEVEEEQMSHEQAAFDTWVEALKVEPSDERPRKAVFRSAGLLDKWGDAAAGYEGALSEATNLDITVKGELLGELANVYDQHLANTEQAISAYTRLLEVDPGNIDVGRKAAVALDRLYDEEQRWPDLIAIVRKQAEWAESADERKQLLSRIAEINEDKLDKRDEAIAAWNEVANEDPEDTRSLDMLERLYAGGGQHRELVDILRRRVETAEPPEDKKHYLRRIASLQEEQLESVNDAIIAHLEVLDHVADDRQTLIELSRLYLAETRHPDLLDVLERRLNLSEEEQERVELTSEIAALLHKHLQREAEALERYSEVLSVNHRHVAALRGVEALLDDEDLRLRAAEILQPIYEVESEHTKLAALLLRVADSVDDAQRQLECLRTVVMLREQYLEDKEGAFDICSRAVRVAVSEPEMVDVVNDLQRFAGELGKQDQLIDIFKDVAPDVLDGELQRRLYLDIADLARALRQDNELAREYYQRVLDSAPDDQRALAALEDIYRTSDEHDKLYEILVRKADLAGDNLEVRAEALSESARLCSEHLSRPEDAVAAWEQVLELVPNSRDATGALEKLYKSSERWHDLVELLERRLGYAFSVEEAVDLRFRLGELHEHQLQDPDAAVDNYSAALGGDPNHQGATAALERSLDDPASRGNAAQVLEPIYVAQQDWPKLVRIYEIKLDASEDPTERLQLTRYISRLYEEQLEDLEGAFRWYGKVFREAPEDSGVRDQLNRLATILEDWEGLAAIYQDFLDDESGQSHSISQVALTAADIYDRRTNNIDDALSAYRRVIEADNSDLDTFARAEAMLTRVERWNDLINLYEDGVQNTMDDERRQDLYTRSARVFETNLDNASAAVDAYRAVMDIEPMNNGAADELHRLYEARGNWFELAELLQGRVDRAADEAEENKFRLTLADIMQTKLEDVQGAIDHYEIILMSKHGGESALQPLEVLVQNEEHRERIAELLEPVYRANDWWQKLVVILDAQLAFVDDQDKKVGMLREIADLHESRGGDPNLALQALAAAWKVDPANQTVYQALWTLAAKLSAWDQLVETLEEGIKEVYDYDLVGMVRSQIAEIHEVRRTDLDSAIKSWRGVLEVKDDDDNALASLDRLLLGEAKFDELVKILDRRVELAPEATDQIELLHRAAAVQESQLNLIPEAIGSYKAILNVDDGEAAALDALQRLYRQEKEFSELANILLRKTELLEDPAARRPLQFALAELYDKELDDSYESVAQLNAILEHEPEEVTALALLDEQYKTQAMWPELVEIIDRRLILETDVDARAELAFRGAQVVEKELMEADNAIGRYSAVLELNQQHLGARGALDNLANGEDTLAMAAEVLEYIYRAESAHDELADLYERRLKIDNPDMDARRQTYAQLVEVHEVLRSDLDAAFGVWARALAETPEDTQIQGELERLTAARGTWEELAKLLEERLDNIMDSELEYAYASKLAHLYEEAIGDLDRAAEKYRRALDCANDEREALAALDRIYGRASKFQELSEILAREAEATLEDAEQADFLFRLGDVRERGLTDLSGAVRAYADALERVPQHSATRGALERLLSAADDEKAEIINILEPLYENEGDFGRLVDLLAAKLSITSDHMDRAQIYARIAELAETKLSDPVRSLDAVGGWLAEDPQSEQALTELERLADLTNRWGEVAARLSGIISSAGSDLAHDAGRLQLKLGAVQLQRLGDGESAEATFRAVLDAESESTEALQYLEHIYRERGEAASLADVIGQRAALSYDAQEKRVCYVEVAMLREQLEEVDAAIAAWKEVLDIDEGDREAHGRLAAIYEYSKKWPELIETLELSARYAGDPGEERALKTRVAQIYTTPPEGMDEDLGAAVDAWQAVLDSAPDAVDALAALEDVHTRREDWMSVQEIVTRRLDFADSAADRIPIMTQLAILSETKRESPDDALGYLYQILDLDNAHFDTYGHLERILGNAERWHDQVELLERLADVYGTLGHGQQEIACYARAADIWEGPLENQDAAGEILEKILAREPNYVPALTRLAKIYEDAQDWERCGEILQKALALGPEGKDAAELYYRLGEVERQQSGNIDEALRYWGQALGFDGYHAPSVKAIEEQAREREEWETVANMVSRREQTTQDADEKLELTLELVELYGKRLNQPDAVIPLLEQAVQVAPEDGRVLGPLGDLYFAAGRHQDAAPIYERLAAEAKKKRKMKDVAKYRQRLGGIFEASGQIEQALAAYEEAFRVNPTDVATMAGLGRLSMAGENWEKARRVYRSMVLQNLDPSMGITKAEVYFNLGTIHVKLNENNKAKGMFQRGLELEPDNEAIKQALAALQG